MVSSCKAGDLCEICGRIMGGGHVGGHCAVSMQNLILCPSQGLRGPSFCVGCFPNAMHPRSAS